jgi:hypothetical protein
MATTPIDASELERAITSLGQPATKISAELWEVTLPDATKANVGLKNGQIDCPRDKDLKEKVTMKILDIRAGLVEIDPKLGEELKIGDWVEHEDIVFQIADISEGEPYYLHRSGKTFEKWYHPSALRKLTPEEALCHITKRHSEYIDASLEALKGRISAIEKQLKEQQEKINQFDGEISHLMGSIQECLMESGDVEARARCREMAIEKRLDFVEKFQREQDDLVNRAIRDGVV